MAEPCDTRRRELARRLLFSTHRIAGLFAGLVFVLVGLSGSILAFREDLDEWLNPALMRVEAPAGAAFRPLDELLAAATAAMPADAKAERLTMPRHAGAAATIAYMVETDDLDSYFYEIFVDPYRAKVNGQRLFQHGGDPLSQPFVQILMTFHWTLLLGAENAYLLGFVGVAMFLSVLAGLYLWFPVNGDWRLGLSIKWGGSPERIVLDAHRSVGIYFGVLLLAMLATGVAMIFKPTTRAVTSFFSPVRAEPNFGASTPTDGGSPIGLDRAAAVADTVFPDGRLHWIFLPNGPGGVYVVGKQSSAEPNRTKTFRNVSVDQFSGAVLNVQDRARATAGETFLEWLFPLHAGEAFGPFGRALALLIGVTPLVLYATGSLRWRRKRRARKRIV